MSRESDIKIVCEALIEKFEQYENNTYDYCRYCWSSDTKQNGDYVHEVNCPVLVAKDLLTLSEKDRAIIQQQLQPENGPIKCADNVCAGWDNGFCAVPGLCRGVAVSG